MRSIAVWAFLIGQALLSPAESVPKRSARLRGVREARRLQSIVKNKAQPGDVKWSRSPTFTPTPAPYLSPSAHTANFSSGSDVPAQIFPLRTFDVRFVTLNAPSESNEAALQLILQNHLLRYLHLENAIPRNVTLSLDISGFESPEAWYRFHGLIVFDTYAHVDDQSQLWAQQVASLSPLNVTLSLLAENNDLAVLVATTLNVTVLESDQEIPPDPTFINGTVSATSSLATSDPSVESGIFSATLRTFDIQISLPSSTNGVPIDEAELRRSLTDYLVEHFILDITIENVTLSLAASEPYDDSDLQTHWYRYYGTAFFPSALSSDNELEVRMDQTAILLDRRALQLGLNQNSALADATVVNLILLGKNDDVSSQVNPAPSVVAQTEHKNVYHGWIISGCVLVSVVTLVSVGVVLYSRHMAIEQRKTFDTALAKANRTPAASGTNDMEEDSPGDENENEITKRVRTDGDESTSWSDHKIDTLFSPMLRFLDQYESEDIVALPKKEIQ
jgi:hypothetical protein